MCLLTPSDQPAPVFSQQCLAGGKMTQSISSRIMEWVRLEGTLDPSHCSCCRGQGPLPLVYLSFYCCWQAPMSPLSVYYTLNFPHRAARAVLRINTCASKRNSHLPTGETLYLQEMPWGWEGVSGWQGGRGLQPGSLPRVPV